MIFETFFILKPLFLKLLQSKNISIFMTSILQISLFALIAVSFALVVGCDPVPAE
jgi:hypothetical protein